MNRYRAALFLLTFLFSQVACIVQAQEDSYLEIVPMAGSGDFTASTRDRWLIITNRHIIKFKHPTYGQGVLVADRSQVDSLEGDVIASGNVYIQRDELVWTGENISYNFLTRKMEAAQFRAGGAVAGSPSVFVGAENVDGDHSNNVFTAENAFITTDDVANPATRIKASSIKIIPGKEFKARHAVLYAGRVPVFYFPIYAVRLDGQLSRFDFVPGYRTRYGAYLLTTYRWSLTDEIDGALHGDYRSKRGGAGGADLNLHLDRWGEASFKYYHLHDLRPDIGNRGFSIPEDRKLAQFGYSAEPFTNFSVISQVRYQGDERILHNFFESEYRANPQPSTFVELNQHWNDFALDFYAQPRINEFFGTVERLPELRLTGFRQQVMGSLLYYESESSAGFYRRRFAETNSIATGANYEAMRADTFHQLTLPYTLFGWLNFVPRAGGRVTYYGDADGRGATTDSVTRSVFNTGAELTFKASRTWADARNGIFALDGLRHIVEPSINYVFVPKPSRMPVEVPQFDFELPSLRLLPLAFPEYNAIDSVDSQSTVRLGIRNRLQTKRDGVIQDFVYWDLYADWRLDPQSNQRRFSDVFSDLAFRPRDWLELESLTRFDPHDGVFRLSFHNVTLRPNSFWSWGIGHLYVRDDFSATPTALQEGNSFITSTLFLRASENWGVRAQHQYEVRDSWLQQQTYSLYRDFRNWTCALTFRVREPRNGEDRDYAVAFTFSLKAAPRVNVGEDAVQSSRLLGY